MHKTTLAGQILHRIKKQLKDRFTISIGGESGCGKTTLSLDLKAVLEQQHFTVHILHMDDYFHLPPTATHRRRLENIAVVGPGEVNLKLLQEHLRLYKSGIAFFTKPVIHFESDKQYSEDLHFSKNSILLVEGTYVTKLQGIDTRIFMRRDFRDTYEARMSRARDQGTDFVEEVLAIEHKLIAPDVHCADIVVDKQYEIQEGEI